MSYAGLNVLLTVPWMWRELVLAADVSKTKLTAATKTAAASAAARRRAKRTWLQMKLAAARPYSSL